MLIHFIQLLAMSGSENISSGRTGQAKGPHAAKDSQFDMPAIDAMIHAVA